MGGIALVATVGWRYRWWQDSVVVGGGGVASVCPCRRWDSVGGDGGKALSLAATVEKHYCWRQDSVVGGVGVIALSLAAG